MTTPTPKGGRLTGRQRWRTGSPVVRRCRGPDDLIRHRRRIYHYELLPVPRGRLSRRARTSSARAIRPPSIVFTTPRVTVWMARPPLARRKRAQLLLEPREVRRVRRRERVAAAIGVAAAARRAVADAAPAAALAAREPAAVRAVPAAAAAAAARRERRRRVRRWRRLLDAQFGEVRAERLGREQAATVTRRVLHTHSLYASHHISTNLGEQAVVGAAALAAGRAARRLDLDRAAAAAVAAAGAAVGADRARAAE